MGTITVRKKTNYAITARFTELAWMNLQRSKFIHQWEEIPGVEKSEIPKGSLPEEILKKKAELTAKIKEEIKAPVIITDEITGNKEKLPPVATDIKKTTEKKSVVKATSKKKK